MPDSKCISAAHVRACVCECECQKQYSISNLIILKCMDLEEFELFARNIGHIVIFCLRCRNALEGYVYHLLIPMMALATAKHLCN